MQLSFLRETLRWIPPCKVIGGIAAVLTETMALRVASYLRSVDDGVAARAHMFVSYGNCSIDQPVDDLVARVPQPLARDAWPG